MFQHTLSFFQHGGVFMAPLALLSLISVSFILERGFALRRNKILPENLKASINALEIGGSTQTIEDLTVRGGSTLARLVRTCLEHLPWSKAENVEAVQTNARSEVVHMERGLIILEITVGISPLLGLLGTVSGLVVVFGNIGSGGSIAAEGAVLARGIAEALNTTVAGLVIAIPSLIAHSYYVKKIESMTVEMESICMDFLAKLYLQPNDEV